MKLTELTPEFVEFIPTELKEGILYISLKYNCAIHLCACGCGSKTVMDLNHDKHLSGWDMTLERETVDGQAKATFSPSIGNFSWEKEYHAHYRIIKNKIVW